MSEKFKQNPDELHIDGKPFYLNAENELKDILSNVGDETIRDTIRDTGVNTSDCTDAEPMHYTDESASDSEFERYGDRDASISSDNDDGSKDIYSYDARARLHKQVGPNFR